MCWTLCSEYSTIHVYASKIADYAPNAYKVRGVYKRLIKERNKNALKNYLNVKDKFNMVDLIG